MLNRAYSTLEIKSVDAEQRIVEGIASTPSVDRGGDSMDPAGAQFTLPIPFLWKHKDPIGEVFAAEVRPDGIHIKARVSTVADGAPAYLKDRVEEAWHSFTSKPPLVRGLSVGWNPVTFVAIKGTPFLRHVKWIWGELSAVVVPMNVESTILAVKELDLAASGLYSPGVTGSLPVVRARKDAPAMTIQEQITSFENTRAAKAARMNELMTKASETGVTLDAAQTEEYDGLSLEVKSVDAHLVRLRDLEKSNIAGATRITNDGANGHATEQEKAAALRGGTPIVQVKSNLPPGTAFTRYAMALMVGKGDMYRTLEHVKQWKDSTPEVEVMVKNMELLTKAAVYPGTIADATWAAPLAQMTNVTNEFLELLRPATLLGKIPNLRRVPFNVSVPIQTAGGTYGWVGEGAPKPVTNLQLGTVTLTTAKAAGIIVLTEELVRLSSPSAEATVRADMIAGIAGFLDTQFVDPAVAAVTNVSPASITNGTVAVTSAGTSSANAMTDLKALVNAFTAANLSMANAVFLMSEANAFALATAQNALSQSMFPGMAMSGGTLFGRPVITSQALGSNVILVDAQGILFADDGGVTIDVSREASVEMNTAPTSPVVAGTVLVSLWQQNLVGLRAERFINWKRARLASVKYVVQAYV